MTKKPLIVAAILSTVLLAACGPDAPDASPASSTTVSSDTDTMTDDTMTDDTMTDDTTDDNHDHSGAMEVSTTSNGLTLTVVSPTSTMGGMQHLMFYIVDENGMTPKFEIYHEKMLHLLLVNHTLDEYRHLHPEMTADGQWHVETDLSDGYWRMVAEFTVDGEQTTLGTDLVIGDGPMKMADFTEESRTSISGAYTATLTGDTDHAESMPLKVTITENGAPISKPATYLGALGHMVAFSAEHLAYVHIHANDGFSDGTLTFTAPALDHGFYKVFLQVQIDEEIELFEFVLDAK